MPDILLVDDDADFVELLSELLRIEGHRVRTARNGREGLERLAERRSDVVLLDVEMPVLGGPGMVDAIRVRDRGLEKIPVVLTSGVEDLREVAAQVGTPYFLGKPYAVEALLALIERALAERRAQEGERLP